MPAKKSAKKKKPNAIPVPPAGDWRTTDQDEIHRRTQRAIDEKHSVTNLHPEHPIFSNFAAKKQKVAQLLTEADLAEEAEPHRKAAEKALAEAEGIEGH